MPGRSFSRLRRRCAAYLDQGRHDNRQLARLSCEHTLLGGIERHHELRSEQIAERIIEFRNAGVEIFLMQMSPMLEEMERFAEEVMPLVN